MGAPFTTSPFDLTITSRGVTKGFLLAHKDQVRDGARVWQRQNPLKPDFRYPYPDVQPGQLEGEFIIAFDSGHAGWGEARRRTPNRYAFGRNVDARFGGQITLAPLLTAVDCSAARTGTTAPAANPVGFYEFPAGSSTTVYFAWGQYVVAVADTASPITVSQKSDFRAAAGLNLANAVITQVAVFDRNAHLASYNTSDGTAHTLIRHTADATLAAGNAGTEYDAIVTSADSTGAVLYAVKRESSLTQIDKLTAGANPTDTANWTDNGIQLGDPGEICRWLTAFRWQVFASQPNGLHAFDEGLNSVNILPDLRFYRNATNGQQALVWHGKLYVPHVRGLFAYDGNNVESVGPVHGLTLGRDTDSRRFGYPTALVGDADWLYVAMWNGTDTYVFAGQEGEGGGLVWHPWLYLSAVGPVTCLYITAQPSGMPRLLLGSKTEATALEWCELPRADNPLQDPPTSYAASGTFITSTHDAGLPGITMTFEDVVVEVDNLHGTTTDAGEQRYITIEYRMADTDSWTSLGDVLAGTNSATNVIQTLRPASDTTGRTVQFRVTFNRGTNTDETPVLRTLKARVIKRLTRTELTNLSVQLRDGLLDRFGHEINESAASWRAFLKSLESEATPFTVGDPLGDSLTVLLEGDIKFEESAQFDNQQPEIVATFAVRSLTLTPGAYWRLESFTFATLDDSTYAQIETL